MDQTRVLLICLLPLLCEGLRRILQAQEDVQLVYLERADPVMIQSCFQEFAPETVLIAGERTDDAAAHLISDLLNRWPDVPVVWIELEANIIRLYTSHMLPADSKGLIAALHQEIPGSEGAALPFKSLGRS